MHTELPSGDGNAFSVLKFSGIPCKIPVLTASPTSYETIVEAILFLSLKGGFEL